jgi:hypothetical protein
MPTSKTLNPFEYSEDRKNAMKEKSDREQKDLCLFLKRK